MFKNTCTSIAFGGPRTKSTPFGGRSSPNTELRSNTLARQFDAPFNAHMSTRHTFEPEADLPLRVAEEHGELWVICGFLVWLFTGHFLTRPRSTA